MKQDLTAAFDVGNTRIKCAILAKDAITTTFTVSTHPVDSLFTRLKDAHENEAHPLPGGIDAVVSSVCPAANKPLQSFLNTLNASSIRFLGGNIPIPSLVKQPETTGTDRLLCALAAREQHGVPSIVIMAGTAITVDLVDENGQFAGGAICPGYTLCALAMERGTASLPRVSFTDERELLGSDTVTAIQSGIDHFCRGGVNSLIEDISGLSDASTSVVITGGDAERLMPLHTDLTVAHRPLLIFDGIRATLEIQS